MEDLTFYTEFVTESVRVLTTPGLTKFECYATLMSAQQLRIEPMPLTLLKTITLHSFSKKDLDYWTCVTKLMAKYIAREIKAMVRACLGIHFCELLLDIFVWVAEVIWVGELSTDIELSKLGSSRDPPLVFIPIPKIESNGCVRSDLNSFAHFLASGFNPVFTF